MDQASATSERLAHYPENFAINTAAETARRPVLALTAEGPRRADLIAWASTNRAVLARLRLLAPAGIGTLLAEHVGLHSDALRSGTVGATAAAGLAAAGDIDAMIALTDPIELRAGDTTTRSLARLAVFWDIPIAGNRATADLLLGTVTARTSLPPADLEQPPLPGDDAVVGPVKLWTVRASVDDVPGRLAVLAASLARRAINILSVQVHLTPDGPVDELLVAASPVLAAADLTAAVIDGGARTPSVSPADAHALVDGPTRALHLATRLVRTPDDLSAVLTGLLPDAQVEWRAEPPGDHEDAVPRDTTPRQLWLTDPTGGGFLLTRPAAAFTPAECARAYAMMDIATVALARATTPAPESAAEPVLLADGTETTVRRATPDDLAAVIELHARCSLTTLLRRYLVGTRCPTEATLSRLLSPAAGHSLVVEDPSGRLIAMGNLMWDGDAPELALLVEDQWQQRRLGSLLARRLVAVAATAGAHSVKAAVHAGNTPMIRTMSAVGHRLHREYDGGLLTLIAALPTVGQTQRSPSSIRLNQSAYGIDSPTYIG